MLDNRRRVGTSAAPEFRGGCPEQLDQQRSRVCAGGQECLAGAKTGLRRNAGSGEVAGLDESANPGVTGAACTSSGKESRLNVLDSYTVIGKNHTNDGFVA